MALSGYQRRAYAACVNTSGAIFSCSGDATANTTTQNISHVDADVSTVAGFGVNNSSFRDGIIITGDGALSFTDTHHSSISTSYYSGAGVFIAATADHGATPGSVTVNTNGTIYGARYGIFAANQGTGNTSITLSSGASVLGSTGVSVNYGGTTAGSLTTAANITGSGGTAILLQNIGADLAININGGHINGDVTDNAPANGHSQVTFGDDFTTNGNFTVSKVATTAGKTFEIGSGNTITTQSFTPSAGTLTFGATSAATHGELTILGGALNLTGETITIDVTGNVNLSNGGKILLASGTAPITGGPGSTPLSVTSNAPNDFAFHIVDGVGAGMGNADDLYLEIQSFSACTQSGSNYSCSNTHAVSLNFTANDASVSTQAGFGVSNTGANAITITGDGALSFTDTNHSTIMTSPSSAGLYMNATADDGMTPGSVTINANGNITGGKYGIFTKNSGTGTMSITLGGDVTGTTKAGVYAKNTNAGTSIGISIADNKSVSGGTYGIWANDFGTSLTLNTGANSHVTGTDAGIHAIDNGRGDISIATGDNSYVGGHTGITALNNGSNYGSGLLSITTGANSTVKGTAGNGISAVTQIDTGDLNITTGAGSVVYGTTKGIYTYHHGNGSLNVTLDNDVSDSNHTSVLLKSDTNATAFNLITNGNVTGAGYGIHIGHNAPGASAAIAGYNNNHVSTNITVNGDVTGTSNDGVYVKNYAYGGLNITTGASSSVIGNSIGLYANNLGIGGLTAVLGNNITDNNGKKVVLKGAVSNADFNLTTNGNVLGAGYGIHIGPNAPGALTGITGYNLGSGDTTITVNGDVTGTANAGIYAVGHNLSIGLAQNKIISGGTDGIHAYNNQGTLNVTTAIGSSVTGGTNGIWAKSYSDPAGSAITIATHGTVSGIAGDGIHTFNGCDSCNGPVGNGTTSITAFNSVSGSNYGIFANNSNIGSLSIKTYGTVAGTNQSGIYAKNYGTDLSVTTGSASDVTGSIVGIKTRNLGNGDTTISTGGTIDATDPNGTGIYARNGVSAHDLTITTAVNKSIIAGYTGIKAKNSGLGALSITVNGDVTGTNSNGIYAINYGTNLYVGVAANKAITAGGSAIDARNYGANLKISTGQNTSLNAYYGIHTINHGSGYLTINSNSNIGGTYAGVGIFALNYGTNITIDTGNSSVINAQYFGIKTKNFGTGDTHIYSHGNVYATNRYGIYAYNKSTANDLIITTRQGTNTNGHGDGIKARNFGVGNLYIFAEGNITQTGDFFDKSGIFAYNASTSSGNIRIQNGANSTISGTYYGIQAKNKGAGSLLITASGTVNGAQQDGIYARNYSTSSNGISIGTASTANITGFVDGIYAKNQGNTNINITAYGNVTGTHNIGIEAYNTSQSNGSLFISTGMGSNIEGASFGIHAANQGKGSLSIFTYGYVKGTSSKGVLANNFGTDLIIQDYSISNITGATRGIEANNFGSGYTSIYAGGTVHATSNNGRGISAYNKSTAQFLTITTGTTSNISGGRGGITAENFGAGDLTITANGIVTGTTEYGIEADNNGSGHNLIITTGDTSDITGGIYGIAAINQGDGSLTIQVNNHVSGGMTGTQKYGVYALNFGTDLSITAGTHSVITSSTYGIRAANLGSGSTTIDVASGAVINGGNVGIFLSNDGGIAGSLTTAGSITGSGGTAIQLQNLGVDLAININGGAINGDVTDTAPANGHSQVTFGQNFTTGGNFNVSSVATTAGKTLGISSGNTITTQSFTPSASTLTFGVTSSANHGELDVINGALDITGETFTVDVVGMNTLSIGNKFLIATGSAPITGGPGATPLTVTDNSSSFNFDIVDGIGAGMGTANELYLEVLAAINDITVSTATMVAQTMAAAENLTITSSGSITGVATGVIVSGGTAASSIDNSGTITATTGISVNGAKITSGGITNESTGTITGTGGTAIALTNLTGSTPIFINGGHIIGDVTDNNPANNNSPVTVAHDFTSEGNFTVSGFTVSNSANFTFGAGKNINSFNGVNDSGTIKVNAPGSSITGGLNINSGGSLVSNANFGISGALINNGNISIATGTTLTTGTMSAGTGTISFGLTSAANHGELVVSNGAANLTGQTISINVAGISSITNSSQILLVHGASPITGGPGATPLAVTDNSVLWNFKIVNGTAVGNPTNANDLFLVVDQSTSLANQASSHNNAAEQTLLAVQGTTSDPKLLQILANLNSASTTQALDNVLQSVQPSASSNNAAATASATKSFSDIRFNLASERLESLREDYDSGMSAGDITYLPGLKAWSQFSNQIANQGVQGGFAGYSLHSDGTTIGLDTPNLLDGGIVGLAFSYGQSRINAHDINTTRTDVDSYQLALYSGYDLGNHYYVNGIVGYTFSTNTSLRHNVGLVTGLDAKGKYDSSQFAANVEAGRAVGLGHEVTLTPFALSNWAYYKAQGYTETGAGGADLSSSSPGVNYLDLGIGTKLSWDIKDLAGNGDDLVPQLHTSYSRDLVGDRVDTASSFAGGGGFFNAQGAKPSQHKFNLGAQIKYYSIGNFELTANYDFDAKAKYTSHTEYLKLAYRF